MDIMDYIIRIGFIIAWMLIAFMFGVFLGQWTKRNEEQLIKKCIEDNWRELSAKRIK